MMRIHTYLATGFLALAACMSAASPVFAQLPPAPNDPDAIARLDAKAQTLHREAAELYARGLRCRAGVADMKEKPHEAFECFRKAADNGNLKALCKAVRYYLDGVGVPRNKAKAIELLKSGFAIRSYCIEFNQLVEEFEDELDQDE